MLNLFICYMAVGLVMAIGLLAEDLPKHAWRIENRTDIAVVVTAAMVVTVVCLLAWPWVTWSDYSAKEADRHG